MADRDQLMAEIKRNVFLNTSEHRCTGEDFIGDRVKIAQKILLHENMVRMLMIQSMINILPLVFTYFFNMPKK